jgi:hypothetical protein
MAHLSRRKLLTAIPVLTPAAVGAITIMIDRAESAPADPVLALILERQRMVDIVNGECPTAVSDAAFKRECAIDRELTRVRATTVAGALAAAALIRQEVFDSLADADNMGPGELLILGLIESIEGILRRTPGA